MTTMDLHRKTNATTTRLSMVLLVGILAGNAPADNPARDENRAVTEPMTYAVDADRIDTADDFNAFLDRCSLEERVCLMQSMMGLDGAKLERHHFGKVAGLKDWTDYAENRSDATSEKPLRPKTYNDVAPATVVDAIERAILPADAVSAAAIRRELQWACYSKVRYRFLDHGRIDYHKQALQWVCDQQGIPDAYVESLSTFDLEAELVERFFERFWDKLDPERRIELLGNVETIAKTKIGDKAKMAAIAAMAAATVLEHVDLLTLYSAMTANAAAAAGFSATLGAGPILLGGPVGWGMAAVSLGVQSAIVYNWPDSQRTANFVITAHLVKERWNQDSSQPAKSRSRAATVVASRYPAFAAVASDSVAIPGLDEGLIPQGLTYLPERNWFLFSAYAEKQPSEIIAVDTSSGEVMKRVRLKRPDGTDYTGHAGGIAATAGTIVVSSGKKLHCLPIADFLGATNGAAIAFVREIGVPNNSSYCSTDNGTFWVGEFRHAWTHKTDKSHHKTFRGENFHSWLCGYVLKNGELPLDASGNLPPPDFILETPDCVQGASVSGGTVWLSVSYGRGSDSALFAYDSPIGTAPDRHFEVGGTKVPVWFLGKDRRVFSVTAPPMSENLCRVGDDVFVVFESGAKKFRSGKCPVDRLFRFRNKPLGNGQSRQKERLAKEESDKKEEIQRAVGTASK